MITFTVLILLTVLIASALILLEERLNSEQEK